MQQTTPPPATDWQIKQAKAILAAPLVNLTVGQVFMLIAVGACATDEQYTELAGVCNITVEQLRHLMDNL